MSPARTAPPRAPRAARPGPRPAIDPRIRARRLEVAKGRSRRRRVVLLCLLALTVLAVGGLLLLHSSVLAARVVKIEGSPHTPPARVLSVAGLSGHPPLIDVDPGRAAARLEQLPWIRSAAVTRHWPDGLTIAVTERTPVAVVATTTPSRWLLVDATGRIIETLAAPPPGLVHVVVPAARARPGWLGPLATPALTVAASLPRAFSAQVNEVSTGRAGNVTLTLDQSLTVSFGPAVDLKQKYEDVAAILAGATLHPGDVIDVTVPGAPAVGPNA